MKRISLLTVIFAVTAFFGTAAYGQQTAAPVIKIGVLDVKKIVNEHPASVAWSSEFLKLKTERENEVREQIKAKFNVSDEKELTEDQKPLALEFYAEQNKKFQNEMLLEETKRLQQVEEDIFTLSKIIASEKGLFLILDRSAVIFGETADVTDDLIKLIKEKKE